MRYTVRDKQFVPARLAIFAALVAMSVFLASCNKAEDTKPEKQAAQKTFASPADAGAAFLEAAKSADNGKLVEVFGPDAVEVLLSGDAVQDRNALQDLAAAYGQMHRWRQIKVGGEMLAVGADNYLFPIPLGQNPSGQWYFDTAAGKDEILARHIGKDELSAIAALGAVCNAQAQYFIRTHDGDKVKQYAQKFVSDAGKQNGLYWPTAGSEDLSPLDGVGAFAKAAGYTDASKTQPFNGYFFRILTGQGDTARGGTKNYLVNGKLTGGFAVLAWPAEYRNSGIMTFMVGKDGVVYQKDLGEKTAAIAPGFAEYNPGDWKSVL